MRFHPGCIFLLVMSLNCPDSMKTGLAENIYPFLLLCCCPGLSSYHLMLLPVNCITGYFMYDLPIPVTVPSVFFTANSIVCLFIFVLPPITNLVICLYILLLFLQYSSYLLNDLPVCQEIYHLHVE